MTRPPDLRLLGAAVGVWGASLAALHTGPTCAVWAAAATTTALAVVLIVTGRGRVGRPHTRAVGWAAAAVLLGVLCGLASTVARTSSRDAEPLASLARSHTSARVEMTITDDPRVLRGGRPGPTTYLVPARLTRLDLVDVGAVTLDARVIVFGTDEAWRTALPSQRVVTDATLASSRGGDLTAAVVRATGSPQLVDRPSWTQVAAGRLRAGLQAACAPLPVEPGGLLPGLVIGDTSKLDPAVADEFRITGLTHLVAVSGANVAIVLGVVLFCARWCRAGPGLSVLICAVALAGFVILARPSPSVVRAAGMGAIGLLALASGRTRAATPALAAAVITGLLVDPALAVDPGFALSVLATGGLVLFAPRWSAALRARGVPGGIAEALAVPAAAQVACGPVVVALSGEVSLVAIPANLLAAPAVAPATLIGVVGAVVSPLWPGGAEFLAWLASWPARWLVAIADVGARVPAGAVPWPPGLAGGLALAAVTVGILVAVRRPALRRLVLVAALGVAVGAVPVRWVAPGWPPEGAVVVACDVGQGDAIVLPVGPGEAVVVDSGPEPLVMDRCLRRLGVKTVPLVVVTHFHVDHIGGLSGVVLGRRVGGLVLPTFDEPAAGEAAVRATATSIPVIEVGPGWTYSHRQLSLRLLAPTMPHTGTRSDSNNNSLVLRALSRGVSVVLAADAEVEEQRDLLALGPGVLKADVLKVAHHGSAYQEPHLLDEVQPSVALVSVGEDNPYGHPNPSLLARLARDGVRILRTDRDGDIAVVVTGAGISTVVSGKP